MSFNTGAAIFFLTIIAGAIFAPPVTAWLYADNTYLEIWAITIPALLIFWGAMGAPR